MTIYGPIIGACWIAFIVIWFVLALRRNTGRTRRSPRAAVMRLVFLVALVVGVMFGRHLPMLAFGHFTSVAAAAGCALSIAGLAFATWARVTLGRSWGMPMTLHENPALVTSGPYRYVRHPIYTGLSAMVIGTTLVFPALLLWCVLVTAYVIISARREERDMAVRFADAYPAYKRRSKMLVPFVL